MPKNGLSSANPRVITSGMINLTPGKMMKVFIVMTCCCEYTVK